MVPPDKLAFDIDFGWNVKKKDCWEEHDWQMHERIENIANKFGINTEQLRKIFYNNAVKFFNL